MKRFLVILCAVMFMIGTVSITRATTLTVDGGWYEFFFDGVGSSWFDTFDFVLPGTGTLTVTDAFLSGDQFDVTGFGLTSTPTSVGDSIGNDYDTAASDSRWSTGVWTLDPGTYSITGTSVLSPFGGGGAALRVDTSNPVPEPATLFLLGSGLIGLAGVRKRSKKA